MRRMYVVASPPGSTFSRARCAEGAGPRPLRSRRYPRGLPWLGSAAKKSVYEANLLVEFSEAALRTQVERGGAILLEHPEDLGRVRQKGGFAHPASIWQWPIIRSLTLLPEVRWGALYQSDFGTNYKKPTRLLSNLEGIEEILSIGDPKLTADGDYKGPLQPRTNMQAKLRGATSSGDFRTASTAAWPAELCKTLSGLMVQRFTRTPGLRQPEIDKFPSVGGGRLAEIPPIVVPKTPAEDEGRSATRRKISSEELDLVRAGRAEELDGIYVGRVTPKGGEASKWGNPFRIGVHGDREGVVKMFQEWIVKKAAPDELMHLKGRSLLCHCGLDQTCHADVLLALANKVEEAPGTAAVVKDHFQGNRDNDPVLMDYLEDGLPTRPGRDQKAEAPLPSPSNAQPHGERKAYFMGKSRSFEDGGGLCSPGRWRKEQRHGASPLSKKIMHQARILLEEFVSRSSGGKDTSLVFMLKIAAGRFEESPFDSTAVDEMLRSLQELLGLTAADVTVEPGQAFRLDLIGKLMQVLGDPDWEFFAQLKQGVPLGVGITMPRTPKVFDQKVKWTLDEEFEGSRSEVDNYQSMHGYEKDIEKLFQEEAAQGWMKEMTDEDAKAEYGNNLHVAALAVVAEKDKFRVVHDGTHGVKVNPRIRVQDQVKSPSAGELRTLMMERHRSTKGSKQFVLVGDVSKAHRRIKIRRQDWGWQACRLRKGHVWLNCVGTYGIASAGYWWARLSSALLVRLFYYLMAASGQQDALLFADDLFMVAGRASEIVDFGALILVWMALGVPWKWKKFRGGHQASWIGYWMCFESYELGISAPRAAWLCSWIRRALKEGEVQMADFRAVLGRISFTLGVLDYLKPFVSPLFSWAAAVDHLGKVRIPWSVAFLLSYIMQELEAGRRTTEVRPRELYLGPVFRADAKAEGQLVVLGGWECRGGCHPSRARWFSLTLTRKTAPWAFSRGEPFRTIAALELFASLVSLMVFGGDLEEGANGVLHLTGLTDNAGNVSALARLMTSKFPLVVILTELAAQMQKKRLELDLQWIPRNQNEEADAITNHKTEGFDPSLKVEVVVADLPFLVLPRMIQVADHLYEQVREARAGKPAVAPPAVAPRRPLRPLRERDPW